MYTILVNDDNSLSVTKRDRIMQRSTGFDAIRFLVNPTYQGYSMADCTLTLRYKLPVSQELRTETLALSSETYNGFLQYIIKVNSKLTHEPGDIVCNLTFTNVELDADGQPQPFVRKLNDAAITINAITDWDALVPDELLSSLDQRILVQDKQIKQLAEIALLLDQDKADGLKYQESTLQLTANGDPIGNQVYIPSGVEGDYPSYEDGIPTVDFSSLSPTVPEEEVTTNDGFTTVLF